MKIKALILTSVLVISSFAYAEAKRCVPGAGILLIKGRHTPFHNRSNNSLGEAPVAIVVMDSCSFEEEVKTNSLFRKLLDEGKAGDNFEEALRGAKKEEVEGGQVLRKSGSVIYLDREGSESNVEGYYLRGKKIYVGNLPFSRQSGDQIPVVKGSAMSARASSNHCNSVFSGKKIKLADDKELLHEVELQIHGQDCDLEKTNSLSIKEAGRSVGAGVVIDIIE